MKKDVFEYYTRMQLQMNDMNKILEKVNKEIAEGKVSEEQRANFEQYYYNVSNNYNRVSYIVHLLNQPPEFIRRIRERKIKREQEKAMKEFEGATLDEVIEENERCIDLANEDMKELEAHEDE